MYFSGGRGSYKRREKERIVSMVKSLSLLQYTLDVSRGARNCMCVVYMRVSDACV